MWINTFINKCISKEIITLSWGVPSSVTHTCKYEDTGLIPIIHTKKSNIDVQGSVTPVLWGREWRQIHCCSSLSSYPRWVTSHVQGGPCIQNLMPRLASIYAFKYSSKHVSMYQYSHVCTDTQRGFNSVLWINFVWLCKEIERTENHYQVTDKYLPQLHSTSGH